MKSKITSFIFRTGLLVTLTALPVLASADTVFGGVDGQGGGFFGWSSSDRGGFGGFGGGFGGCSGTVCGVADTILYLINGVAVPLLFAVSFIVFLYGVANKYIIHPDDPSEGHSFVLYGIVGFVIMISIWGLVNIVANTFGLQGAYAPPLPTSFRR